MSMKERRILEELESTSLLSGSSLPKKAVVKESEEDEKSEEVKKVIN